MRTLAKMAALMALGTGLAQADVSVVDGAALYPEGPLWKDGKLYYVEYAGPGIKVWDGKAARVYWSRKGCGANALAVIGTDHLLVACYDENVLVELDQNGKEVRVISKDSNGRPFVGPNDFASDGAGGIYFSASGSYDVKAPITGAVLHLSADGRTVKRVAELIHYSNGLTLSRDGKSLLVAEMLAGRILAFAVQADHTLGERTVWARLQDLAPVSGKEDAFNGPDGVKLGSDGNYYIAQNGSGRVIVVDEQKKLVRLIEVKTPYVTNVGFGADGAKTVYITGAFDQFKPPFPGAVYVWRE